MATELTLQLDEELIQKAEAYSKREGKTVAQLVVDYLQHFPVESGERSPGTTSIVGSLRGVLRNGSMTVEDYRRHLEEKYL
jgi:hypothetical protein